MELLLICIHGLDGANAIHSDPNLCAIFENLIEIKKQTKMDFEKEYSMNFAYVGIAFDRHFTLVSVVVDFDC